jgi:hypothetical protein
MSDLFEHDRRFRDTRYLAGRLDEIAAHLKQPEDAQRGFRLLKELIAELRRGLAS